MKTFIDLTEEQKEKAITQEMSSLLEAIISGAINFNDKLNGDNLQARINTACEKANDMRTPWFSHEYIMDTCSDDIRSMSEASAHDALYSESNEHVITGIAS